MFLIGFVDLLVIRFVSVVFRMLLIIIHWGNMAIIHFLVIRKCQINSILLTSFISLKILSMIHMMTTSFIVIWTSG